MSDNMIERVAKAIHPHLWEDGGFLTEDTKAWMRESALRSACTAIEAMREPTEHMLDVGTFCCEGHTELAMELWREMTKAALAPPEPPR
jgi:pentatricopeptide repeat protein